MTRKLNIQVAEDNLQSLPFAQVVLVKGDVSFVGETNWNGKLQFNGLEKGVYFLSASLAGYYYIDSVEVEVSHKRKIIVEMKSVDIPDAYDVDYSGGWMSFEDKEGNIRCVHITESKEE